MRNEVLTLAIVSEFFKLELKREIQIPVNMETIKQYLLAFGEAGVPNHWRTFFSFVSSRREFCDGRLAV